jgi:hypothetical protein
MRREMTKTHLGYNDDKRAAIEKHREKYRFARGDDGAHEVSTLRISLSAS